MSVVRKTVTAFPCFWHNYLEFDVYNRSIALPLEHIIGRNATTYEIWPCPDGQWCCTSDVFDCCNSGETSSMAPGTMIEYVMSSTSSLPTSQNTSPAKLSCPTNNSTVIGASVSAVLGCALLLSLGAILILIWRLRSLKLSSAARELEVVNTTGASRNTGTHVQELGSGYSTVPELDGRHIIKRAA